MISTTLRRKLSPFEKKYSDTLIQLSVEVSRPSEVQAIVDRLVKHVVPLHTAMVGDELIYNKSVKVLEMPKTIRNISESCDWICASMHPSEVSEATLGYNERFISFSTQHMVCDGGYFKWMVNLMQKSSNNNLSGIYLPKEWNFLPISSDSVNSIQQDLKKLPEDLIYNRKSDTSFLKTRASKEQLERDPEQFVRATTAFVDAKKTHCYVNGRVRKLTESLWVGLLLSIAAYNQELSKKIGIATCLDLRDRIRDTDLTWGFGNYISILSHCCQFDPKKDTLEKVGQMLRAKLNERVTRGEMPAYFLYNLDRSLVGGSTAELSNLGPIFVDDPVKDVFMQIMYKDPSVGDEFRKHGSAILSLLSWSVVSKEKNEITLRLRYQPSCLLDKEAETVTNSLKYYLENLSLDLNVEDAFEEIKKFQNNYIKNL